MDLQNAMRQQQLQENEKNIAALKEKMQKEMDAHAKLLAQKEEELQAARAAGGANVDELQQEVEKEKKEQQRLDKQKISRLLAEGIRQKQLQAEYDRVEKQLNEILPLVNEANQAAAELNRKLKFSTKMVKRLDPFLKDG